MSDSRTLQDADFVAHAQTYHRFMLGVKWAAIHMAAILVFLVLAFATSVGVLWGLVAGAVVFSIGVYVMNHGLAHSTEHDGPSS